MTIFNQKISLDNAMHLIIMALIFWGATELHNLTINLPVLSAKVVEWQSSNEKQHNYLVIADKAQDSHINLLKSYHVNPQLFFQGAHTAVQ